MKIKDRLLLIGITGGLAAIAANIFLYTLNMFIPGQNINMPELTAEIFLEISPANISLYARILGFIWSMTVGGIYCLIYIAFLDLTQWRYFTSKGILVILGVWLVMAGFVIKMMSLAQYTRDEPLSIAAFFVAHVFFAIVLSLLVKHFGSEK